LTVLFSFSLAV